MKIWFFIFLVLPILGCIYIGWHVWRILPLLSLYKRAIIAIMLMSFLCLFGYFLIEEDWMPLKLSSLIYKVGTSSLIILLYLFMIFLLLDIGRMVHLIPNTFLKNSVSGSLMVLIVILGLFIYGNINYNNKVRVPISLKIDKPLKKPLTIVMISDLHLGYNNNRSDLGKWVDLINAEKPDVVLIGGDIVDISLRPLIEENMSEEFHRLKAPVFTCLGNHDYYANKLKSESFIAESGIKLLRDSSVTLFDELTIIGRDDRENKTRKALNQLVEDQDREKFTILLDHQPYHLDQAEKAGIDFQFSGHTHYGQVWPINWIEDKLYENAFGPSQRGNTKYYVSSGIGIWGGKFRIGTRSEYLVVKLTN